MYCKMLKLMTIDKTNVFNYSAVKKLHITVAQSKSSWYVHNVDHTHTQWTLVFVQDNLNMKPGKTTRSKGVEIVLQICLWLLTSKVDHFVPLLHGPLLSVSIKISKSVYSFSKYCVYKFGNRRLDALTDRSRT